MLGQIKVLVVFGTRPEIIKLAPVYRALLGCPNVNVHAFYTGQHVELADGLLELFGIKADYCAQLMGNHSSLAEKTGQVMVQIGSLLRRQAYDWLIVQGDTVSALAGAAAGFLARVPVAHVEAGLRTNDLYSPWPEEFDRRVVTLCAQLHFPPTEVARANLQAEGVASDRIVVTGNTVIDALLYASDRIGAGYVPHNPKLRALANDKKLVLVTGHRRENFGEPMQRLLAALADLARDGDKLIVFPVHLNPNVLREVHKRLGSSRNVCLLEPLRYPDFVYLLSRAWIVVTDSGGIQEEAPSFRIPIVITRDTTERPEVISAGFGHLVGCDAIGIADIVRRFTAGDRPSTVGGNNPFGDGHAAERIAAAISSGRFGTRRAAAAERLAPVSSAIQAAE